MVHVITWISILIGIITVLFNPNIYTFASALILFLYPQFFLSRTISVHFYNDYFLIKRPLFSIFSRNRTDQYNYHKIKRIRYIRKLRENNILEITHIDGSVIWYWLKYRWHTKDKREMHNIFSDKNIDFLHSNKFSFIINSSSSVS